MGNLQPPTMPLSLYDFWGSENDWPAIFHKLGRMSQTANYPLFSSPFTDARYAELVERGDGAELLRIYADFVQHTSLDDPRPVQNKTEFKLGGVINFALKQDNRIGVLWNQRCVVPRQKMSEYQAIWRRYAHVPSKGHKPENVIAFLREVAPLIGVWSLELARGYGNVTKTAAESAKAEAEEELLVRCLSVEELGMMGEDVAQNPALNTYSLVRMDVKGRPKVGRDLWEKIAMRAEWLTLGELYQAVRDGHVVDPYTLTGLKMLEIWRPDVYAKIAV